MSINWLTAEDAARLWNIPFVTVHYWRRVGCPALGGRRLRSRKMRGRGRRPQHVFYRPDLEAAATRETFNGTLHDAAGDWLSVRAARERYGFSPDNLATWRTRPCPQLGGRKLRAQFVKVMEQARNSRRCQKRWVHHADDLAQIAAGFQQDNEWLTGPEARERYGFSEAILYLWCQRGCLHLAGRKLRSRKDRRSVNHGLGENRERLTALRVYAREDLENIARSQRLAPESTADRDWLTYREAKQLFGLNQATLSGWRLKGAPALDGRRLAAKKTLAGVGNRMMVVWKYARADLERIAQAKQGLPAVGFAEQHQRSPAQEPATVSQPKRRGRKRSEGIRALGKYCYEQLAAGLKRRVICRLVHDHFGGRVMDEPDITTYARNYANREGKPWPT